MAATNRTVAELRKARRTLGRILDEQGHALTLAWLDAWTDIVDDLETAILAQIANPGRASYARRVMRARVALRIVSDRFETVAAQAGVTITADARAIIAAAAEVQPSLIASTLPDGVSVSLNRLDAGQIDAMVSRTTDQIVKRISSLTGPATAAMKSELIKAVAAGTNPKTAAANMLKAVHGEFQGGLHRALVIARTEQLDAYRKAAQAAEKANAGVLAGWEWVATLGPRTCPACVSMHGRRFDLDEPGPQGHPQCRCVRVPVTRTWAELGIVAPEPPSAIPDAATWFNQLPEGQKRDLLGPGRYKAWQDGNYPMDQWAAKHHNPGWRDSWQTTPVPSSRVRVAA